MAFPDTTNTGVPAGTSLTRYTGTLHITQDNTVIDGMDIVGDVVIDADNVTIKNSKITSTGDFVALRVQDGASGFTLQDSEVASDGSTQNGMYGHGTFLRNNFHGFENGMVPVGPSLIQDNYIHGMAGGSEAHFDGIEMNGGQSNITIRHNTVVNEHDQTAAVMMNNDFGGLSNITIEDNRLIGGGYTVYLDDRFGGGAVDNSSIRITDNIVDGGHWGDFALYGSHPVVSGNVDDGQVPAGSADGPTVSPPDDGGVVAGGTDSGSGGSSTPSGSGSTDGGTSHTGGGGSSQGGTSTGGSTGGSTHTHHGGTSSSDSSGGSTDSGTSQGGSTGSGSNGHHSHTGSDSAGHDVASWWQRSGHAGRDAITFDRTSTSNDGGVAAEASARKAAGVHSWDQLSNKASSHDANDQSSAADSSPSHHDATESTGHHSDWFANHHSWVHGGDFFSA